MTLNLQWILPSGNPTGAAVIGPPGDRGPPGNDTPAGSLVTDVAVAAGAPLAIDRTTGHFVLADALIYARATVVGLAYVATTAGYVVDARGAGNLVLTDWTAITGAAALLPGQLYFLAEGGGLTTIRPTARGRSVAIVGEAVSPTTLNLRRSAPVLL